MTTITLAKGYDTFNSSAATSTEYGDWKQVRVRSGVHEALAYFTLPTIKGRTVLSATLTGHAMGAWSAQTLTGRLPTSSWSPATSNWANRPSVSGPTATVATGTLTDGQEWAMDVAALLQSVANGQAWYGLRVTTDAASVQKLYGFRSGQPAWTLTYELSDAPEQPSTLEPSAAVVVGETKPKLSWDFVDFGGVSTDQAAFQVQIDPLGAGGGAADWDSGTVSSPLTGVDLSTTSYPGFSTAGGTTQWRVRVQDGSGLWSEWSDWATWTYRARPTLTVNSPTGGVIQDPTPPILATAGSGSITAYRVTVADNTDQSKLLHDSGKRAGSGTSLAYTPPLVDPVTKAPIFLLGKTYLITVYVWDAYARSGPAQTATATVTLTDGAPTAPVLSSVTPHALGYPQMTVVWTRATAPDNWLVLLDGQPYKRLELADVGVAGTTYTWVDPGIVSAHETHSWTVKAIVGSVQGPASNAVQTTTQLECTWLVGSAGAVKLRGTGTTDSWVRNDRAALYRTLSNPAPVIVYDAAEGLSGQVAGLVQDETGLTHAQALTRLAAMKADPVSPVWLVAERVAVPVWLLNLSWAPHQDTMTGQLLTRVSCAFEQATDPAYGA